MDKLKIIIRWALVAVLALCALGWSPSLTAIIFLIAAIVALPIKPLDEFCKKIKMTPVVRGAIIGVLFVLAFCVAPDKAPATAAKEERLAAGNPAAQEVTQADTKEDVKESDNENNNDVQSYTEEVLETEDPGDTEEEDYEEYEISDKVIGQWIYSDRPIATVYEFNADGTWRMTSEGGGEDQGTYEIINDSKINLKGDYYDHEFEILDVCKLIDENGEALEPYDPNTYWDSDSDEDDD